MAKGTRVTVDGKLRQSRWSTQDGQNRSKLEVIADTVELPPRNQGEYRAPSQEQPTLYDNDIVF